MKSYYLVYSQPRSTNFEVPSVAVVDQEIKQLTSTVIPMVKVLWRSDAIEEMSCETEAIMISHYSYFFDDLYVQNFEDKIFIRG